MGGSRNGLNAWESGCFPLNFQTNRMLVFSDLDQEITDSWISNVEGLHLSDSAMYSSIFGMILSKHRSCFWLKCLGRWVGYRHMCMCIIVCIYIYNPRCHFLHRMGGVGVPIRHHSVESGTLWLLPGFNFIILKAWSFMGTKTNQFVTNKKQFCRCL